MFIEDVEEGGMSYGEYDDEYPDDEEDEEDDQEKLLKMEIHQLESEGYENEYKKAYLCSNSC